MRHRKGSFGPPAGIRHCVAHLLPPPRPAPPPTILHRPISHFSGCDLFASGIAPGAGLRHIQTLCPRLASEPFRPVEQTRWATQMRDNGRHNCSSFRAFLLCVLSGKHRECNNGQGVNTVDQQGGKGGHERGKECPTLAETTPGGPRAGHFVIH